MGNVAVAGRSQLASPASRPPISATLDRHSLDSCLLDIRSRDSYCDPPPHRHTAPHCRNMSSSSTPPTVSNPVVLVSIDGWGHSTNTKGNAIANAETPHMDALSSSPHSVLIDACGLSVGLPAGVMGNSEVGHLTMGVGRVEFQDLVRINMSLEDGSFFTNRVLQAALDGAKQRGGRFHLLGLVSDGGVHSHIDHLEAFIRAAKQAGVADTFVHFFADGRDTPPTSGTKYIQRLLDFTQKEQYGKVGTKQHTANAVQ